MRKWWLVWLGATASLLLTSCTPDMLVVPVRICVIRDSTIAPSDRPDDLPATTTKALQIVAAASEIWRNAASIGFLPYPDVRLMDDPYPADIKGWQRRGDIVQDLGRDASQEVDAAIQGCDALWAAPQDGKPPGVTVVFVREFVSSDGGINKDLLGFTPPLGSTQCTQPYNIDAGFVRSRWSMIKTFISSDQTPEMWLTSVSHTTAHELGHLMLVAHGNGKDDDANGLWDEACDPIEYHNFDQVDPDAPGNLMHASTQWGTSLSPLQRELARTVAAKIAN